MAPKSNQYKPLPTLDEIRPHVQRYWLMRKTDKEIVELLNEKHLVSTGCGIGLTSFRRMREELGLKRTRQQGHTLESIHIAMTELREKYPKAGAREMSGLLFHEKGMSVSRALVSEYFRIFEPALVREQKAGRLKRRRFWAAGVNDILAIDQHDKWQDYGLRLHLGLDPFPGRTQWLKVWWTNSNPKLIASYYLDFLVENGYMMPLVSQSDPGTENYGVANITTALQHWHDPNLIGTLQHRWMRDKGKNVMPEIAWSQLRRRFTPGFEDILEMGIQKGWYDINNLLDVLVFCWIFIPWIQKELDAYRNRINNSKKRADRNKILPHGVPNDIYESPEHYGCLDFKVKVEPAAIEEMRKWYAPPNDRVFQLVPPSFEHFADILYQSMGSPTIQRETVWDIYRELLFQFSNFDQAVAFEGEWEEALVEEECDPEYGLLDGQANLLGGVDIHDEEGSYCYMGGVNNGAGLDLMHHQQLDAIDPQDFEDLDFSVNFSDDGDFDSEPDEW